MRNPPLQTLPTFGEIVPGAGGRLAGIMRGPLVGTERQADYALIVRDAAAGGDLGNLAWGTYGVQEAGADSITDGLANTLAMAKAGSPAAKAVTKLKLDGLRDWYIPARGELWAAYANVPELFSKDWHWSSTQDSRLSAFAQGFAGGGSHWLVKDYKLRVRAFRRIPLLHFNP